MTVLITGASGYIGGKLAEILRKDRDIVCIYRAKTDKSKGIPHMIGHFNSFEDLQKLNAYSISSVVHLAAVTGGCSEEDGLNVNVLGTRTLYRYLLDRGCQRFITASSIAATGCLSPAFIPQTLPIPDEHPCLAQDAYGMSKAMVEQLIHYLNRKHPETDFTNFRFGSVVDDETWQPNPITKSSSLRIPFTQLSSVYVSDVLDAILTALDAPQQAGVRTYNVVGKDASCCDQVADILQQQFGDSVQQLIAYYRLPGNEQASIFDMRNIKAELGFEPKRSMQAAHQRAAAPS